MKYHKCTYCGLSYIWTPWEYTNHTEKCEKRSAN